MTDDATFTVIGRPGGFEGIGEKSVQDLIDTMAWIKEVMPNCLVYSIKGIIAKGNKVAAEGQSYGVTTKVKFTTAFIIETMHAQQILIDDFKSEN